jgi:hypothetical protein
MKILIDFSQQLLKLTILNNKLKKNQDGHYVDLNLIF